MKIQTTSPINREHIESVRSQIRVSDDLRKFDTFLAKYDVIDFNDTATAAEARKCCGGENCCHTINVTVSAM